MNLKGIEMIKISIFDAVIIYLYKYQGRKNDITESSLDPPSIIHYIFTC